MQYVPRDRRRSLRRRRKLRKILPAAAILAGVSMAVFGLVNLTGYGADLFSSRRTAQELRDVYYTEATEAPAETAGPSLSLSTTEPGTAPDPIETFTPAPETTLVPEPIPAPAVRLSAVSYPGNPGRKASARFRALQSESKYIIGWLKIGSMLDQPVVQRDDVFFMNHDAKGKTNVNGAIFLDSMTSLKTRPYTYTLYGHNMKSGEMFGCLRNFEKVSFYQKNPFISFDTMYEDGRYVIFAVGTISTDERSGNYADLYRLRSLDPAVRAAEIDTLIAASVHTCTIDVQPEDQLLILVTCVDKDEDRRVVAARRIREGEHEADLKQLAERSRKK